MFYDSQKMMFFIAFVLLQIFVNVAFSQEIELERVDVACEAETICDYNSAINYIFETPISGITTKPWPSNIDSCDMFIPHWVAIIPGSDSIQLRIQNSNCGDDQLRIGLFRGIPNCKEWPYSFGMGESIIGNCMERYPQGTTEFDVEVEAGLKYYLVFGDNVGGICNVNFSIENKGPEIEPEVNLTDVKELTIPEFIGGDTICIGADSIRFTPDSVSQNAEYYLWKLPDTVIKRPFIRPYLDLRNDYFNDETEFELCIASANNCDTSDYNCREISVNNPTVKEVSATQCLGYDFYFRDTIIETSAIQDPGTYEYEFFASSPTVGCDRFYKLTMNMKDGEKIEYNSSFSINSREIRFNNSIKNQDSIKWYFGDGDSSTVVNPTHEYDSFGEYEVIVDIYGVCDFVTDTIPIAVIPDLSGEINVELPNSFCVPTTVEYMIDINNEVKVTWYIEGSQESTYTGHSIDVNFIEPGIHSIYVQYSFSTNSNTYVQDTSLENLIELYEFPSASFDDSISNKTVYLAVNNPIDSSSTYVWDFGDETTANGPAAVHTYEEDGTYVVELTETNPCGTENMQDTVSIEMTSTDYYDGDNSISVYPNPFREVLNIGGLQGENKYSVIKIYNIQGKQIKNIPINNNQSVSIDTEKLCSGFYFINLISDKTVVQTKLMKH